MLGLRVYIMRKIMAVLAPLTGDRATGVVRVSSTPGSGTVNLPSGCFGAPILAATTGNEAIYRDRPVFTLPNPAASDGSWDIEEAGTDVSMSSVLGGARNNLPIGAKIRWDPVLTGIELVSDGISTAWMGGANSSGDGSVRRVVPYEDLGPDQAKALFAAQLHTDVPAIVLAWNGTGPHRSMGRNRSHRPENWVAYVVCERRDGTIERGNEGANILDLVESYLMDRGAVDGHPSNGNTGHFSDPPVAVTGARRVATTPSSYIYALTFNTHNGLKRIDPRAGGSTWQDWENTQHDLGTATTPSLPVVDGAVYPQS